MATSQSPRAGERVATGWRDGWGPDRLLTVDEWADANVQLTSKDSSEPGPYRTSRTPYVREISRELSPQSPTETIVWMAGAQVAKTRVGLNWIGHVIDVAPGPMLMVQPTVEMAKKVSKQRLATMIESAPALRGKVAEARSRDSGNTMFEKEFPGGMLMLTGANSAVGLRSMPIRYLFLDEVDGYPGDVDGEGDPVDLARKRASTFARRKIFMTSTPTIKGLSRIEAEFLRSDQRRYFVPCPHCGFMDWIRWERIQWADGPASAQMLCTACGAFIDERHKTDILARGEWRPTAAGDGRTAGFHLSSLYAPVGWASWAEIVAEFLASKDNPTKLKTWINTRLGETWEERGDELDADSLKLRLEDYGAEVPPGVGVLTAAVDVQGDRLECAVKGWGAGEESWLIALHQVHGDPAKESTWFELDQMLTQTFQHGGGRHLAISAVAIDSGGLHTEHVYRYCKTRQTRRIVGVEGAAALQHVYAIKGMAGSGREILGRPTTGNRYHVKLFIVGVDTAKDTIFSRMRIAQPGPGYVHLPAWADEEYLAQLTSEKAIRKYKKGVGAVREYVKVRERNEGLDLEVYALAALYSLGRQVVAKLGQLAQIAGAPSGAPPPAPVEEEPQTRVPSKPRPGGWFSGGGGSGAGGGGWIGNW